MLTFFTEVKTTRVTPHGPFSVVIREGTTTFYRNATPASFTIPDSFQSGEAILSSTIRQQVILDTVEKTFRERIQYFKHWRAWPALFLRPPNRPAQSY
jgi:hypothetical protein